MSGFDPEGGVKYATNTPQEIPEMPAAMFVPCFLAIGAIVVLLVKR